MAHGGGGGGSFLMGKADLGGQRVAVLEDVQAIIYVIPLHILLSCDRFMLGHTGARGAPDVFPHEAQGFQGLIYFLFSTLIVHYLFGYPLQVHYSSSGSGLFSGLMHPSLGFQLQESCWKCLALSQWLYQLLSEANSSNCDTKQTIQEHNRYEQGLDSTQVAHADINIDPADPGDNGMRTILGVILLYAGF
ncbi:hypothetical protein ACJX0J_022751 [Zea mays]